MSRLPDDFVSLFEGVARRTPDRIAISAADGELSYRELNSRANRLARRLINRGVAAESRIALCFGRNSSWAVAILAVWKAGGAYVPLDPAYPDARLAMLAEDIHPDMILTEPDHIHRFDLPSDVVIDNIDAPETAPDDANPGIHIDPGQLAYIIYTSGSTGQPKGVQVEHRSLGNILSARTARVLSTIGEGPVRVALASSFSFDAVLFEMMWLVRGDHVWITDDETRRDSRELVRQLRERRISAFFCTPSQLTILITLGLFAGDYAPSMVDVAGEAITPALWESLRRFHTTVFFNVYGPTETTVYITEHRVDPADEHPTIGRPIPNVRAYVVGEMGEQVPDGSPGELWVGGLSVSRGYWRRPELTAERFIEDPFSPGGRVYRTGDLVRRRTDGCLEFLGRVDDQIALRGYRIEPGEIAATLTKHSAVDTAAVTVKGDNQKSLVAYVVPTTQPGVARRAEYQIEQWRDVFQRTYARPESNDPDFDIAGWISSYTGLDLTAEEMREWVAQTVARIRKLSPRRVLEIGVGTGLLLWRLAPDCERYVGTDFSAATVEAIRRRLAARPLDGVTILHQEAAEFTTLDTHTFDCIILNSVVQYFPDEDYLNTVLHGALALLSPGGHLFVGDVRHLGLLDAFHTSVVNERFPGWSAAERRRAVIERRDGETELLLSPRWFELFAQRNGLTLSAISPRSGRHDNELTRFRYDVAFTLAKPAASDREIVWRDFAAEPVSLAELDAQLARLIPGNRMALRRIPNTRVAELAMDAAALFSGEDLPKERTPAGELNPWVIEHLAAAHGVPVALSWRAEHDHGAFDAVLGAGAQEVTFPAAAPSADTPTANSPRPRPLSDRALEAMLREYLVLHLPEHMIPTEIISLPRLPLTQNGKLDHDALPDPAVLRERVHSAGQAPMTPTEETVAAIWSDILGLGAITRNDNFFRIGGDSLAAARMLAVTRVRFGTDLTLRQLLTSPTVAGLATVIDEDLIAEFDAAEISRLINGEGTAS